MGRPKKRLDRDADQAIPARTRAEKAADRREAIVNAALDEFAEKGFAAARIEDVARRADVSKGTIYLHFQDKDALFEGIVRQVIAPAIGGLGAVEPSPGESARDFAARIFLPLIRDLVATRRGDLVRLIIADGARFPGLAEVYYKVVAEGGLALVRRIAGRAAETGELSGDALVRFPQLFTAPVIVGIIWTSLFDRFQHLDVEAMFAAHLDLLFRQRSGTGANTRG
jgi:AcrR family transcriptional regulator